jgi:hypothetical protein
MSNPFWLDRPTFVTGATGLAGSWLVRRILSLVVSDLEPDVRDEPPSEIRNQCLSATCARKILNWKPLFDLEERPLLTIA